MIWYSEKANPNGPTASVTESKRSALTRVVDDGVRDGLVGSTSREPASWPRLSRSGGPTGKAAVRNTRSRVVPGRRNSSPNLSVPPESAVPTARRTRMPSSVS
jgi:hypothetical protein